MNRLDSSDVRIALCSPYGFNRVSGVSQFVLDLRRALLSSHYEVETFTPEDVRVLHKLPPGLANIALAIDTFRQIINSRKHWTAIHANQPHLQSVASVLGARLKGARSVVTIHSPFPPSTTWTTGFVQRIAFRLLASYANHLVYVSQATKEEYGRGPGDVIRIGVDLGLVSIDSVDEPRQSSAFVGLFNGRQTRTKGFFDLLDAVGAIISERGPSAIRLLLLGDHSPEEAMERSQRLAALGAVVEDRGFVADRATVLRTFREADVLVLPSYREGLPLVLLEAMAVGCVPIVSDVGGITEVVENGRTGLVITPGDVQALRRAIEWAMDHPAELKLMGSHARSEVTGKFPFERTVADYVELYRAAGGRS